MKYLAIALLSLLLAFPAFATPVPAPAPAPDAEPISDIVPESAFVAFDDIANHYKCYRVLPFVISQFPQVRLSDQFKQSEARVIVPRYLCNPTKKNNTGIVDEDLHYVCFEIEQDLEPVLPDVRTSNQFGTQLLRPVETELLCLPSKKEHI